MTLNIDTSLALPPEQYIQEKFAKTQIVLHHTVGGSAKSTIDYWKSNTQRIGTAFVVERDGTVYQAFDPIFWACHLGVKGNNNVADRHSIGIEIASEGGLTSNQGNLYTFGVVSPRTLYKETPYDNKTSWRGFQFFDPYNDPQIDAVIKLVDQLCTQFNIPRVLPQIGLFDYSADLLNHHGIIGHANVRQDKSDIHPGFPVDRLIKGLVQG